MHARPDTLTKHAAHAVRTWWHDIERAWFVPTALPLARAAEVEGWAPDPDDAYCHRCGGSVGPGEADASGCAACRNTQPHWIGVVRLGPYRGFLRERIHELKFARRPSTGIALGRLLGDAAARRWTAAGEAAAPVIVAMPTTRLRRMTRGVDHAAAIAQGLARQTGWPLRRALARTHRPPQRAVAASARPGNVSGVFRCRHTLDSTPVVLVDDVMTSGSTARAAARTLLAAGADSVTLAVVAVTPARSRREPAER